MQDDGRRAPYPLPATTSGAGTLAAPAAQARINERNAGGPASEVITRATGDPPADASAGDPPRSVTSVASLIGSKLLDAAGEPLGDVTDVTIDAVSGRVAYLIVAVGAVLGMGGERFAVPWTAVRIEDGQVRVAIDRETLAASPVVEPEFWPEMSDDERWARAVHEHFGASPYWLR